MKEGHKILSLVLRDDLSQSQNGINCLTSTSNTLISGSRDGVVREYNMLDRSLSNIYNGHVHWVNSVACSEDLFLSASSDSRIQAWRWGSSLPVQTLTFHKDYVHSLNLHENFLYSGGEDGLLVKTDLEYKPNKLHSFTSSIWHLDYQNNLVVLAMGSKNYKLVDFRSAKPEIDIKGHSGIVRKALLSPDNREVLTCSSDGFVKLWDLGTRKVKESFHIHSSSVFALKCFWEQGVFLSGDKEGFVYQVQMTSHLTEQVCKEAFPVLDIEKIGEEIWVATTNTSLSSYCNMEEQRKIPGKARKTQFALTDNKKFIITKDSEEKTHVIDVLSNKLEESESSFSDTLAKLNTGKNAPSWITVNIRLGCVMLDLTAGECLSAYEISEQQQVFFAQVLLGQLFLIMCGEQKQGPFDKNWLILRQNLAEKTEVYWMSQVKDLMQNKICEVPVWVKDIIPDVVKGITQNS